MSIPFLVLCTGRTFSCAYFSFKLLSSLFEFRSSFVVSIHTYQLEPLSTLYSTAPLFFVVLKTSKDAIVLRG